VRSAHAYHLFGAIAWLVVCSAVPADAGWFSTLPSAKQAAILWSADLETGNTRQWSEFGGTNDPTWSNGDASWQLVNNPLAAHSGSYALSSTINSSPTTSSAVRWPRRVLADGVTELPNEVWYSTWLYLPQTITGFADHGGFFNLMQWKTADGLGGSDPIWSVNLVVENGKTLFELNTRVGTDGGYKTGGYGRRGLSPTPLVAGRWTHLEAYYDWSTDTDGQIQVYQDGTWIFGATGVKTQWPYAGSELLRQWTINDYAQGLSPNPFTILFDDSAISQMRLGIDAMPVPIPGDFNGSGRVDAADYSVWRNGLGTIYTPEDYATWKSHFGQTAAAGASAAIPEPESLILTLAALIVFLAPIRRQPPHQPLAV
jgi:Polysaccharide lyase